MKTERKSKMQQVREDHVNPDTVTWTAWNKDTVFVDTLRNNWTVVDSRLAEKYIVTKR